MLPAALSTVLPKQNGAPLVTWEKAERSIGWNLLFLIAGGMAVGGMISDSGAAYGQNGIALTTLSILAISLFGWLLMRFVPAFGLI